MPEHQLMRPLSSTDVKKQNLQAGRTAIDSQNIFIFRGHNLTKVSYLVILFRKIATILLLSFLFFNWVGYWLFISWFESHVESQWELRLDNEQYDPSQLVLVKVSADRLPYSNASTGFE